MSSALPGNVTISSHPCLRAKLSQLRAKTATPKEVRALVKEISTILAVEVLGKVLNVEKSGTNTTPLEAKYDVESAVPKNIALIPILRSGLAMVEAFEEILPSHVPVHHLGLYREKITLQPVEYYNNLPTRVQPSPTDNANCDIAIVLDPIVATGGTAEAAIQTLREWGVGKIIVVSVLGSHQGVSRAATESGGEGIELFVGAVDEELARNGMLTPGVGDIGDRLFLTIGK